MIIHHIEIGDEAAAKYGAGVLTEGQVAKIMAKHLTAFADFQLQDRPLVVSTDQKARLEVALSMTIEKPEDVIRKVERLVALSVEGIEIKLDPDVVETLRDQAEFYGQSVQEFTSEMVKTHMSTLFA